MPEAECVNLLCRCVRCVTALEAPQYCSQHKKHHQPVAVWHKIDVYKNWKYIVAKHEIYWSLPFEIDVKDESLIVCNIKTDSGNCSTIYMHTCFQLSAAASARVQVSRNLTRNENKPCVWKLTPSRREVRKFLFLPHATTLSHSWSMLAIK